MTPRRVAASARGLNWWEYAIAVEYGKLARALEAGELSTEELLLISVLKPIVAGYETRERQTLAGAA
jgi:hypothetical protein